MKKHATFLFSALVVGFSATAQTALYENFDAVPLSNDIGQLPSGWTAYADNQSNAQFSEYGRGWVVSTTEQENNKAAISVSSINGSTCDRWLVTPPLAIASSAYRLTCRVYAPTADETERLRIALSTTDNQKASFTTTLRDMTITSAGWQYVDLPLNGYAGQTLYLAFVNHGNGVFVFVDDVRVEAVTTDAVALSEATIPAFMPAGQTDDVRISVRNMGTSVLHSVDYSFSCGSTSGAGTFSGLNIAPSATANLYVPVQLPSATGTQSVAITIGNPNGNPDPDPADNSATANTTLFDPSAAARHVALLENFTTQQCGNCPGGHESIEAAMSGATDRVTLVCHHVGYGTDQFTVDASSTLLDLYTNGEFAPAIMLDRDPAIFGSTTTPVYGSGGLSTNAIRQAIDAATLSTTDVSIAFDTIIYNPSSRQLTVTVGGRFLASHDLADPRVGLFIVEDSLVSYQSGAGSNYRHDRVLRAAVSDIYGDPSIVASTAAGSTYTHTFTLALPATWRADHCALVAFVAENGGSRTTHRVANAVGSPYISGEPEAHVGIAATPGRPAVAVRPNPVADMAYITAGATIHAYTVVDAAGRQLMAAHGINADMLELDVSALPRSLYLVRLATANGPATAKINVR